MKKTFAFGFVLAAALGCGLLKPKQELESEKKDLAGHGGEIIQSLSLNSEGVGKYGDPDYDELKTKLTEINKQRTENGVFREGSNEIYNYVILAAGPKHAVGNIWRIANAIKLSGC